MQSGPVSPLLSKSLNACTIAYSSLPKASLFFPPVLQGLWGVGRLPPHRRRFHLVVQPGPIRRDRVSPPLPSSTILSTPPFFTIAAGPGKDLAFGHSCLSTVSPRGTINHSARVVWAEYRSFGITVRPLTISLHPAGRERYVFHYSNRLWADS